MTAPLWQRQVPIAITMGDPAGIGPEIIAKVAVGHKPTLPPLVVVGDAGAMQRAILVVGANLTVHALTAARWDDPIPFAPRSVTVLQVAPPLPPDIRYGQVDRRAGAAAYAYIQRAIDLTLRGDVCAIVTAPINKEALAAAGVPFPGHTEILASRSGSENVGMMLANDELRVLLVSIHVSLSDAIRAVTYESELRTIRLASKACKSFGISAPRVAVAGLNPHASENGMFGNEEREIIAPAITRARQDGIDASGPWPGDTVFMRARRGEFDIVVAQYHDQGLIPVKYLGVDQGVNITVGLPFIRTSVDHGTAFDIAGTGRADHMSLAYAVKQAAILVAAADASRTAPGGAT